MEDFYKRLTEIRNSIDEYMEVHGTILHSMVGGSSKKLFRVEPLCKQAYNEEKLLRNFTCSDIDDLLEQREESFSQMILRLIDEKGLKDSEVYKKANIDRRLFSRLRSDIDYVPSKKTAISFCFALQLSLDDSRELLERAGYSLSTSSRFDLIIMYLLEHREYSVEFANLVLHEYGESTLSR